MLFELKTALGARAVFSVINRDNDWIATALLLYGNKEIGRFWERHERSEKAVELLKLKMMALKELTDKFLREVDQDKFTLNNIKEIK